MPGNKGNLPEMRLGTKSKVKPGKKAKRVPDLEKVKIEDPWATVAEIWSQKLKYVFKDGGSGAQMSIQDKRYWKIEIIWSSDI